LKLNKELFDLFNHETFLLYGQKTIEGKVSKLLKFKKKKSRGTNASANKINKNWTLNLQKTSTAKVPYPSFRGKPLLKSGV
jgi:hypothetical protein